MYIDGLQSNSQTQNLSVTLGVSAASGAAPALSAAALKKAVTVNRVYARMIGWRNYTSQIAVRLGITTKNPDVWSFVQALANWQARNMMKSPDGILGPEWYDLLTRNRRA
ncbi:MAG: hypothetical protein CV088_05790 [Nitrospira sp. LK70]|nr:hypothetical protein [Nitrospira sp. LK70]